MMHLTFDKHLNCFISVFMPNNKIFNLLKKDFGHIF